MIFCLDQLNISKIKKTFFFHLGFKAVYKYSLELLLNHVLD